MNKLLITTCGMIFAGYTSWIGATPLLTQIGRYSTVANSATAAQINPLLAVGQFKFPPHILNVGEAVESVLQNTSYRLVPLSQQVSAVRETLLMRLPITDRTLGPLQIKDVLIVLMGKEVFHLVVDPLHREINFEIKPEIAQALGAKKEKKHA